MFLITTLFLTSCAAVNSGDKETKALLLPDIQEYSKKEQIVLADELQFLMKNYNPAPVSFKFLKACHISQKETRAAYEALR